MRSTGTFAHWLQRVTGVLLLAYLLLHVLTIHTLAEGPAAFDAALATFRHPVFKLLEIALLGTVILHAFNGVRITLIDFGASPRHHRKLFWILSAGLAGAVFVLGAIPLLRGMRP